MVAAQLVLLGTAVPARSEVTKARIGLQFGLVYLPIMVAESEGLFDKQAKAAGLPGLEVTLSRFSGSTSVNEAMLSTNVEFGALGLPGVLIAWDKTRGRQHIMGIAGLSSINYFLYSNKSEIKALSDFTTADKIAVPALNSPQAILLRLAAAKMLGSGDKANTLMMSLPHPDATTTILAGGGIAGYFSTPPFSQILAKDSRVHLVMDSRAIIGQDASAAGVTAMQGFVDDNPKVAGAILAGLDDAVKLIKSDPKRAAEIYLKSENVKLTVDEVVAMMTDGSITYDAAPHGVMLYARAMQEQNLLKNVPSTWKDVFLPVAHGLNGD
jgi:NitT/TauT family transport system substrate-binding protein